jgi:hypothetical protein
MVSRASQQRRTQAIDASDKAEGYHLDWLFTVCMFVIHYHK